MIGIFHYLLDILILDTYQWNLNQLLTNALNCFISLDWKTTGMKWRKNDEYLKSDKNPFWNVVGKVTIQLIESTLLFNFTLCVSFEV